MNIQTQKGFTLIELMIVVVIIGILVAVAIPTYRDYVATTYGAAAQVGINNFLPKVQTCVQTGIGCETVKAEMNAANNSSGTKIGASTAKAVIAEQTAIGIKAVNNGCIIVLTLDEKGSLSWAFKENSKGSKANCAEGTKLDATTEYNADLDTTVHEI